MELKQGDKIVVTTEHRGVFFGRYQSGGDDGHTVVLTEMRNCLYWPPEVRGFVGLASAGPISGSRVGPPAPSESTLYGVTAILLASPEAIGRWEASPWM